MTEEPQLTCVRTCQGLDVAQIYRSKLEAMQIPVLLQYESAGVIYGITVDGLGAVHIMVPASFADEAMALLADLPDDESLDSAAGGAGDRSPATEPTENEPDVPVSFLT
jgi:hypothetical protein